MYYIKENLKIHLIPSKLLFSGVQFQVSFQESLNSRIKMSWIQSLELFSYSGSSGVLARIGRLLRLEREASEVLARIGRRLRLEREASEVLARIGRR